VYIWCAVAVNHVIDCVADIVRVVSYRFAVSYLIFFLKKKKGRVWGFFGTAVCRPIVPFPPMSSPHSSPEAPRTT